MSKKGFSLFDMMEGESPIAEPFTEVIEEIAETVPIELSTEDLLANATIIVPEDTTIAILRDLDTDEIYRITSEKTVIGASSECDIILREEGKRTISRNHAVLIYEGGKFFMRDISSNGTYLANLDDPLISFKRIPKGSQMEIESGQPVKFVHKCFIFESTRNEDVKND